MSAPATQVARNLWTTEGCPKRDMPGPKQHGWRVVYQSQSEAASVVVCLFCEEVAYLV